MKKIIYISSLISILSSGISFGQILVSDSISLINPDPNKRQVENLGLPEKKSQAINASSYMHNYLLMGMVQQDGDTISLDFPVNFENYQTGMQIYFPSASNNAGPLFVDCDSLGPKEIKVYGRSLNKNEILSGRVISLIYNGTNFDMQNEINSPCPDGFIAGNKNYCIETNERDSLSFYDAITVCGDMNARLCTWTEWKYACSNVNGINDLTGNYEWINDAGNFTGGFIGAKVVGSTGCNDSSSHNTDIINRRKYRCCYSR